MILDTALRRAVLKAPCSIRALARAAEVSHVTLALIVQGKQRATPKVTVKVAEALERWANTCAKEAARLRASVEGR